MLRIPANHAAAGNLILRRRTRRAWKCDLLHGTSQRSGWSGMPLPPDHVATIPPGSMCVEYTGEAYAFRSGTHYCIPCALAFGLVEQA